MHVSREVMSPRKRRCDPNQMGAVSNVTSRNVLLISGETGLEGVCLLPAEESVPNVID